MLIEGNINIGVEWRFGITWPGQVMKSVRTIIRLAQAR